MTERRRGIVDPWRTVDPVRTPPKPEPERNGRKNLEDVDPDEELKTAGAYTIRATKISFHVVSIRVFTPKDALDVLADCIADAWAIKPLRTVLNDAGIGVRCRDRMFNVPDEGVEASKLAGEDTAIWFVEKPLEQGMLVLGRILRMPEAAALCKRHGITVMLAA
jgi:hypothetical protein